MSMRRGSAEAQGSAEAMTEAPPHPPLYTIIDDMRADDAAGQALARDIIAVHGPAAAAVVRQNASAAALAGQTIQAKSWIAVLGSIQRQQTGKDPR